MFVVSIDDPPIRGEYETKEDAEYFKFLLMFVDGFEEAEIRIEKTDD